jgi:hypothetical protein
MVPTTIVYRSPYYFKFPPLIYVLTVNTAQHNNIVKVTIFYSKILLLFLLSQ